MNTQLFGNAEAPNLFIVGRSGTGKHLFACQRLINQLVDGKVAVVLDCGRSYVGIVKSLGGTLVTVHDQGLGIEKFGTRPLTVYDFEPVRSQVSLAALNVPAPSEKLFVLMDEVWSVSKRCPELLSWLPKAAEAKASFCGVMQSMADFDIESLPASAQILKVMNPIPVGTPPVQA